MPDERPEAGVPEAPAVVARESAELAQDGLRRAISESEKTFSGFSAVANLAGYQGKLAEMSRAYMQLTFEFTQRLARIRSPFELPGLFAEFATRQFAIFALLR